MQNNMMKIETVSAPASPKVRFSDMIIGKVYVYNDHGIKHIRIDDTRLMSIITKTMYISIFDHTNDTHYYLPTDEKVILTFGDNS